MTNGRIFAAEFVGTFILMLGGPGTAVLATGVGGVGTLGVALGFGLALMVAAYAVGPVSGCHINPAVTLGMAIMRKIDAALIPIYWAAQLAGAAFGGLVILFMARGGLGGFDADVSNFAVNLYGVENGYYAIGSVMIAEVVLTAVLMFVVLSTTNQGFSGRGRRFGHWFHPDADPPRQHPDRQHVGESGSQFRNGNLHRW